MSCPKDLHSVYIDDEMPENFISEYETQVKNDAKSLSDFERMKKIHDLLNFDAESESEKIDDEFVQKSFERLQSKMRFAKTVEFAEPKKKISSFIKLPLSFAAAAAVFAVVFVPLNNASKNPENIAINTIKRSSKIQSIAEVDVKIDGNIASEKLPEVFAAVAKDTESVKKSESVESEMEFSGQKTVRASSMVSTNSRHFGSRNFSSNMTSVDVFRPDFSSTGDTKMEN